jgi:phage terminase large subunit-like protein
MDTVEPSRKPLTKAEKEALLKAATAKLAEQRRNPLEYLKLYQSQLAFIAASNDFPEIGFHAGNQRGKTITASSMAAAFATGRYPSWWPGRRWDRPTSGWVCGESREALRDAAQLKLIGLPGDPNNVGFIPEELIVERALSHGATGSLDFITVRHVSGGLSRIGFKSYDQLVTKWQGPTLDYAWCDEEPPLAHYNEASARLIATNGLLFSTFTPLHGRRLILGRFLERTPDALRYRKLIHMPFREAKHITPEMEAAIKAKYPPSEWRSRIEGYYVLGSGQVFEGIELKDLIVPARYVPARGYDFGRVIREDRVEVETRHWAKIIGIDFGIAHYFGAVLLGWDRDADKIYVMGEIKIRGGTPADHASRMRAMFGSGIPVAWPHDGNQREKGTGAQLREFYVREGLNMLPSHATFPTGGYDTEAGILEKITRMRTGRLFVFQTCTEWMSEFENYHREDGLLVKEDDDLMSATRIGVMSLRFAQTEGSDPRRRGSSSGSRRSSPVDDGRYNPDTWGE